MYSIVEPRIRTAALLGRSITEPLSCIPTTTTTCTTTSENDVITSTTSSRSSTETTPVIAASATPRCNGYARPVVATHPARRALIQREFNPSQAFRSVSFDDRADSTDVLDPSADDAGQGEGRKGNVTMDKISTMTLTEFKSLLTSALSVPDDATTCEPHPGITSTASTPGSRDANRQPNWGSVREKAKSVRDSLSNSVTARRPSSGNNSPAISRRSLPQSPDVEMSDHFSRTPHAVRRLFNTASSPSPSPSSTSTSTAVNATGTPKTSSNISRPKTPTAITRPKTPSSGIPTSRPKTPTHSDQRTGGQKEEYRMARPRTPSQMKREAVAKVAGAISNWVESRPEMEPSSTLSNHHRPKTPTGRLLGPSASLDENDEDGDEVAMTLANPELTNASSFIRERPDTPSRIPKPCFIPRPITPKTSGSDAMSLSMNRESSSSSSPPLPPQTLSLSQHLTDSFPTSTVSGSSISSARAKGVISRIVHSNSNSPVMSPQGSAGQDSWSKVPGHQGRPSSGRSQPQTPTSSNHSGTTNSYRDIYSARRCNTPGPRSGSVPRSQPARCVTPGPREKWSLGESQSNGNNSSRPTVSSSELKSSSRASSQGRRSNSNVQRSSSITNLHSDQLVVTNEITFSDDEEINEIVRHAAMQRPAKQVAKPAPRSASVDAKKLIRQNACARQEVLVISRNNDGKHGVQGVRKNCSPATKRPPSRGNSTDRSMPTSSASAKFRSQTPDPSMFRRKLSSTHSVRSNDTTDSTSAITKSGDKSLNRTEAWVDSTISDTKRKLPPRPKQGKTLGSDIPASELEPRPLNEIKAILSQPQNEVDTEALDAPPEDAEMFRKMEKLFEKYREMELRASVNDTPGAGSTSKQQAPGAEVTRAPSHRSVNASSRSSPSVASMKTSSGSMGSSSGGCSSNPPTTAPRKSTGRPASARSSTSDGNRFKRSTSSPSSFQKSPSGSPAVMSPAQEINHFPGTSHNHSNANSHAYNGKTRQGATTYESNPDNGASGITSLKDIDSEMAKDPAALISKIKEILRVRPRKDENPKTPTRIPAPKSLTRSKRSKSVSNLFQAEGFSSQLTSQGVDDSAVGEWPESETSRSRSHSGQNCSQLSRNNSTSNSNVAYCEFVYTDRYEGDNGDVLTDLTRRSSVQSDSGESGNRCETPVPKVATPLTTGRSTFINRRGLSQDKENTLSNSQTSLSSRSMLSTTEDEADFV